MARGRSEAALAGLFRKELLKRWKDCFYYKIPDSPGGPLRPFDAIAFIQGVSLAIEYKCDTAIVPHQFYYLNQAAENGAFAFLIRPENFEAALKRIESLVKECKEQNKNAN